MWLWSGVLRDDLVHCPGIEDILTLRMRIEEATKASGLASLHSASQSVSLRLRASAAPGVNCVGLSQALAIRTCIVGIMRMSTKQHVSIMKVHHVNECTACSPSEKHFSIGENVSVVVVQHVYAYIRT